ncbi:cytochrome c biogenesis CcdA family protein [Facklamia miroungae]|uniref:Cytochrome c-type biogenesis protein n=1 Tax=Facklamia miroungae TaxID=120956 RepID=A0A1G7QNL8_9LACT|nr:cytochrome c biogenesis CcdA family protein [Facklamia miroungae]NKZ29011.1 cytochrome c biogenesis protein CcdA [Facklamia miroungae]SDG00147.1 cytochrome c-type biogenesis protein [Facklamia miroungae]
MDYLLLFIEGLMTFISPCLLPMIPLYIAFFAGGKGENTTKQTLIKSTMFMLGFSTIFILLSLFVSTIGVYFMAHRQFVNLLAGSMMIVMGIDFLNGQKLMTKILPQSTGSQVANPYLFGLIFALSWSPCVGTFLASALTYIASVATSWTSFLLIVSYCLGLGIPFILSALLVDESKKALNFIKKHYRLVNTFSGLFLIIFGLLTMVGFLESLLLKLI